MTPLTRAYLEELEKLAGLKWTRPSPQEYRKGLLYALLAGGGIAAAGVAGRKPPTQLDLRRRMAEGHLVEVPESVKTAAARPFNPVLFLRRRQQLKQGLPSARLAALREYLTR